MSGWIKDYRKELESAIWMMPPLYHRVWQYLKYMANHASAKIPQPDGSFIEIEAGQHLTSIRGIARGVSWYEGRAYKEPNPKTIHKILLWLEANGMIKIDGRSNSDTLERGNTQTPGRGNSKYTLITIVNWALYQGLSEEGVTANIHERKQFVDINKKNKNIKKNINDIILTDNIVVEGPSESESEPEPKPKFGDDHEATILTRLLAKLMLQNNPNARIPKAEKDAQKWIAEMERIHRLDGYSYDEIKKVIVWCQNDDFWKANILSTKKLRKKMPTLVLQMKRRGNQPQGRPQSRYERTVSVLDRLYREADELEQEGNCQTH